MAPKNPHAAAVSITLREKRKTNPHLIRVNPRLICRSLQMYATQLIIPPNALLAPRSRQFPEVHLHKRLFLQLSQVLHEPVVSSDAPVAHVFLIKIGLAVTKDQWRKIAKFECDAPAVQEGIDNENSLFLASRAVNNSGDIGI